MIEIDALCSFAEGILKESAADQYLFTLSRSEVREITYENGEFSLFRTLFGGSFSLQTLVGKRPGSVSGNDLTEDGICRMVDEAITSSQSAEPDSARDIWAYEEPALFTDGVETPDLDKLFFRLRELIETVKREYPKVLLSSACAEHSCARELYRNSNGTAFESRGGGYDVSLEFSGHEGDFATNLDYCGVSTLDLDTPFIEQGAFRTHLENAEAQLHTVDLPGKFTGTVIFTPECLGDFVSAIMGNYMSGGALLSGTSKWKDKLEQQVAAPGVTVSLRPMDARIVCGERYMACGRRSADMVLIDNGILKFFPIGLYVANKTGLPMGLNASSALFVEPGETPLAELISGTERGLLVGGFSGGEPGPNGEYSGVAKNSYYIENGKILGAVNETMINGCLEDILNRVVGISRETVADGGSVLPYLAADGIVISGE